MYVHRSASDNATNCQCQAILGNSTGALIHNNIAHDNAWSIVSSGANSQIYNNSIYNSDHCFAVTNGTSGMAIHDNQCYNPYIWDTSSNAWHHDGIHVYTYDTPVTGTQIYNNFFWGDWGNNVTAHIFLEGNTASSPVNNTQIFNNYFRDCLTGDNGGNCTSTGPQGDGAILAGTQTVQDTGTQIYNNTFTTSNCGIFTNTKAISYQNNVTCGYGVYPTGSATFTVNANNVAPDSHVSTTTGQLSAGSKAIGAGANLTSLGISQLDVDRAGTARPATGTWDAGAYMYGISPSPPTGLNGVVK
jgi:hypothetical protein